MNERQLRGAAAAMVVAIAIAGCGAPGTTAPVTASVSPTVDIPPSVAVVPDPTPGTSPVSDTAVDGTFDIGGRSLYLHCSGSGSPTIILMPGDGDTSDMMSPLADGLATTHRICTYDRANTGRSDPAPFRRPMRAMADDLAALLDAAGETGPFLSVGTSLGGTAAYLFSVIHPDAAVGFVSINPPPDADLWLPAVKPIITDQQYVDEVAYGDGTAGTERYDGSGWLSVATPSPDMPYRIVDSGTTQCEGDPLCVSVYDVIIDQTKDMAARGAGGRWVQVPGSHQLQASNPDDVLAIVADVLAAAGS